MIRIMRQSGITTEGLRVFKGVFALVGTHGIHLEVILHQFKDTGRVVDWIDYIKGALKDGHNPRTIRARVLSAVGDAYGTIYCKEIEYRVNLLWKDFL